MDDGDWTFVAFGCIKGIVFFEDIDEGVLPLSDIVHFQNNKFELYSLMK